MKASLSATEKRNAITRLRQRVSELEAFQPSSIQLGDDPAVRKLSAAIQNTLSAIYGPDSHDYQELKSAIRLDRTMYMAIASRGESSSTSVGEIQKGVARGRADAIALLTQAADSLEEELKFERAEDHELASAKVSMPLSRDVFVVHGHDHGSKETVARFLRAANLDPVILHEQPSGGRTIIEKLEHYSDVGFAVVILTADDVGGPAVAENNLQPRARQNVIAELFYFLGKLKRERVCALMVHEVEIPSDIGGIVYVPFDERGAWKMDVLKELQALGYELDWKAALA